MGQIYYAKYFNKTKIKQKNYMLYIKLYHLKSENKVISKSKPFSFIQLLEGERIQGIPGIARTGTGFLVLLLYENT